MLITITCCTSGNLERRLEGLGIGLRASEAVGPIIESPSAVGAGLHESVALITVLGSILGGVDGDQVVIGPSL